MLNSMGKVRFVIWVTILSLVVNALPLLTPVSQAAGPLTTTISNTSATRTSSSELDIRSTILFTEKGNFAGDDLCSFDITFKLDTGGTDRWTVGGITYANMHNNTGKCTSTPSEIRIINKNSETLKVLNGSSPQLHEKYGFIAEKQSTGSFSLFMLNEVSAFNPNDKVWETDQLDVNYIPISSLKDAFTPEVAGETGEVTLPARGLTVANYTLQDGTKGTTIDGTSSINITKETLSKWLAGVHDIHIAIDTSDPKNTPPPYVEVPTNPAQERPQLKFDFHFAQVEGSVVVSAHKWLIFQGRQIIDGKSTTINGFYFVTDDDANNNNFISAPGVTIDDLVANVTNYVITPPGSLAVPDDDVNGVFNYIMDVPKSGDNCSDGQIYKTGPSSSDGQKVTDIQHSHPEVTGAHPSELNPNCYDKFASGWPSKWGIKVTNVIAGGSCSLTSIFAGNSGIGDIFSKITQCLLDTIFTPIVTWATDLVIKAAGIGWLNDPHRAVLVTELSRNRYYLG